MMQGFEGVVALRMLSPCRASGLLAVGLCNWLKKDMCMAT